ncbi:MAG: type II toxin-antitoxin system RelB/DinJ family antitoxin [Oscillospiraceae bacterium]|nr:type II toxin-antitoxin system RelB/DinJ family antitoxin [Oscillospiraceae bacterium]
MNTNINIRTTNELKTNANEVLRRLGLDMSTAVNIYLTQIVYKNAIPFEISAPPQQAAQLGGWEGKVNISADFNDPMEEFEEQ